MVSNNLLLAEHDGHVHTKMCGHARGEMEEYVVSALQKGLKRITFLEHMEEGIVIPERSWLSEKDFDYYFAEGKRLQQKYQGKIEIGLGVECGYNPDCRVQLKQRLEGREWDQIGISCHFLPVRGESTHLNLLSKKPENKARGNRYYSPELYDTYLDYLEEAVTELDGTLLCHLDAGFRWVEHHEINSAQYDKIDNLLALASTKEMALEVNTSGIAIRNEPFPNEKILALATKHGVRLQLGSDAHSPEEVARYFNQFTETLSL